MELGVWHIALILERIIRTFEQLYPRGIMVRLSKALFLKMRDGILFFVKDLFKLKLKELCKSQFEP